MTTAKLAVSAGRGHAFVMTEPLNLSPRRISLIRTLGCLAYPVGMAIVGGIALVIAGLV